MEREGKNKTFDGGRVGSSPFSLKYRMDSAGQRI